MYNNYQIEIDEFTDRFDEYKERRIVLYGIGRYTATLLEGLKGFQIVGLMDKEPANIGRIILGLPVVDKNTAEKIADMIVINTSETYWNVIYERIKDVKIPIFYKNGKKAKERKSIQVYNPFHNLSYSELCVKIKEAEVISFDFFDTLFLRRICNPQDLFQLMELELKEKWGIRAYAESRNKAKGNLKENYSLDELYLQMEKMGELPNVLLETVKNRELEIEKKLLSPRWSIIESLRLAKKYGKAIYIISDMYLPEKFYIDISSQYEIPIPEGHFLISNVLKKSKRDGSLWKYYDEKIVKGRRALHIGDDWKADIVEPLKYNIQTYLTPSPWNLLEVSSLKEVACHICSHYDTAIMGCILNELFKNPFVLENTDSKIQLKTNYQMGYVVFGPIILSFLLWVLQKGKEDKAEKLVFMSRDGYFLKEDFEYLCKIKGEKRKCCYLGISRQLVMSAAVESKEELLEYAGMPYSGSIMDLLEDRFDIRDSKEVAGGQLEDYIETYLFEIKGYISNVRKDYLSYLKKIGLDDTCVVVDLGYYGNNQKYLNKLAKTKMAGYYFNANLSKQNGNTKDQRMSACFQGQKDLTGENSQVLKKMIYIESFLTAPYGMVKAVDQEGNFICASKKKNQEFFQDKVEINRGVKQFIYDYISVFGKFDVDLNLEFVDWLYGYCMDGALDFSEKIKESFYNDNAMMNRIESMLFY